MSRVFLVVRNILIFGGLLWEEGGNELFDNEDLEVISKVVFLLFFIWFYFLYSFDQILFVSDSYFSFSQMFGSSFHSTFDLQEQIVILSIILNRRSYPFYSSPVPNSSVSQILNVSPKTFHEVFVSRRPSKLPELDRHWRGSATRTTGLFLGYWVETPVR